MAASNEDDNDSPISTVVWRVIKQDLWPLLIGFWVGRAWTELPPSIAGKASAIAVDVVSVFVLLFIAVAVLTAGFLAAVWIYQTVA